MNKCSDQVEGNQASPTWDRSESLVSKGGATTMGTSLKRILVAAMMVAVMGITTNAMAASVTSVSPSMARAGTAGEVVEIVGTVFNDLGGGNAAARVYFGSIAPANLGTSFVRLDATHISVAVPSKTKGTYNIIVTDATDGNAVTLNNGFSFTTPNKVLQVSVIMTIGKNASIVWDTLTDNDDTAAAKFAGAAHAADSFAPYILYLRDADYGPGTANVNLAATYTTDGANTVFATDVDNSHTLVVKTLSGTNSNVKVDAIASDAVPSTGNATAYWKIGTPPAVDEFLVRASLLGGTAAAGAANGLTRTSGVATLTTAAAHRFSVGHTVVIAGATGDTDFNGTYVITTVPSPTSFTYANAFADTGAAGGGAITATITASSSIKTLGTLQSGAQNLFNGAPSTGLNLRLEVTTPTTTTAVAGTTQTSTVSMIAYAP